MVVEAVLAIAGVLAMIAKAYAIRGTLRDQRKATNAGINGPYKRAAQVALVSQWMGMGTFFCLTLVFVLALFDPSTHSNELRSGQVVRGCFFLAAYALIVARSYYAAYAYHRDLAGILSAA